MDQPHPEKGLLRESRSLLPQRKRGVPIVSPFSQRLGELCISTFRKALAHPGADDPTYFLLVVHSPEFPLPLSLSVAVPLGLLLLKKKGLYFCSCSVMYRA